MKDINKYFEEYDKEDIWSDIDFKIIDKKILAKAILTILGILIALLIIVVFLYYIII